MSETVAQPPGTPLTVKSTVLAAIVGLTTQRLGQYAAEGMPKTDRDGYPLAGAVQWIIEYWRKRATLTPLGDARRRKTEADASSAEIELALKQGALADIATMAKAYGAACARVRTRLLAIPSKAAPQVHRMKTIAQVEAELRREITEALEELIGGKPTKT